MKSKKTFFLSLFLFITISLLSFSCIPRANAQTPVTDSADITTNLWDTITNTLSTTGIYTQIAQKALDYIKTNYERMVIEAAKIAALWTEQKITASIIGGSGGGGTITNWGVYLYTNPQQVALTQMNTFFNTVSRGRLSSINYEGIGPKNYDNYLVTQAKNSINGTVFQTNIQSQTADPTQLFDTGNMKGIMTYMGCANNVACYTLTATARYNQELAKAQDIAKNEQSNGFLPQKKNGVIIKPAALASAAFTEIDQLGTNVIMNADATNGVAAGLQQIGQGMLMNIAARSLNYAVSDDTGKRALKNQNDQAPFSFAYSANSGFGINSGNITSYIPGTANAGISGQVGNTTLTGNINCTGIGCSINSSSRKN